MSFHASQSQQATPYPSVHQDLPIIHRAHPHYINKTKQNKKKKQTNKANKQTKLQYPYTTQSSSSLSTTSLLIAGKPNHNTPCMLIQHQRQPRQHIGGNRWGDGGGRGVEAYLWSSPPSCHYVLRQLRLPSRVSVLHIRGNARRSDPATRRGPRRRSLAQAPRQPKVAQLQKQPREERES